MEVKVVVVVVVEVVLEAVQDRVLPVEAPVPLSSSAHRAVAMAEQ